MPKITPVPVVRHRGRGGRGVLHVGLPELADHEVARYGEAGPREAGTVMTVTSSWTASDSSR